VTTSMVADRRSVVIIVASFVCKTSVGQHHPQARRFISSVWDTLTELEQTGHYPATLNAPRRILTHHQPSPAGRRRTCRRGTWRRRPFPCIVWYQIHCDLLGLFADTGRHRQPTEHDSDPGPQPGGHAKTRRPPARPHRVRGSCRPGQDHPADRITGRMVGPDPTRPVELRQPGPDKIAAKDPLPT
jgi:hypothetical protein